MLISTAVFVTISLFLFLFTDVYLVFLHPLDIGTGIDAGYGDVILVLGGGLKKGRLLGYSTEERLKLAVNLFKKKQRPIIVSGGSLYRGSPAIEKITAFFKQHGIEEQFISFEGKSQTTFDNFFYTHKMINDGKYNEVIVSTSPYHQRRSRMILYFLGISNFRISRMNASEIYQAHSIKQRFRNLRLIFREYLAILKFQLFKK